MHEYRLSRDELTAASPVFRNLLTTAIFREASEKTVELHEDPPQALVTCFKILHDVPFDTDAFKSINLKGVWEVLATAHKYDIDPRGAKAQAWFVAWWAANWATGGIDGKKFGYEQFQALLYPCWTFDYAPGWQEATKYRKCRQQVQSA